MFQRIAIVGFGLIGASIALAVRRHGTAGRIVAIDRADVIESAMRMQAADEGGDDLALAAGADLVILAAPVRANIRLIAELPAHVSGDAIVTDVGSTKRQMAAAAERLPERLSFVGGHPLSGAATGGLTAARADLFRDRPWILTPGTNHSATLDRVTRFVAGLGAHVHVMTPDAHDSAVAYLSHLPQIAASALMRLVGEHAGAEGLALAGQGLSDTTRLASSPANIWRDIAATNHDNIDRAIDELVHLLEALKAGAPGAGDALGATFESAAQWKQVLESRREKGRRVSVTRFHLEMRDSAQLVRAAIPDSEWRVDPMRDCAPELWRFLYSEIGHDYHWVDRLPWSLDDIRRYIADPAISIWLLSVRSSPAGYFELRRDRDGSVEIVYFGLLKHFHGRGLGGHFLTEAVLRAWESGATRVFLHTNTLDHPAALANYLKRGFQVFRTEDYLVDL